MPNSAPHPDAIEKLIHCYEGLSPALKQSTWWLSSLLKDNYGQLHHGCLITPDGIRMVEQPPAAPSYYPCDTNMWSGSFYRLDIVRQVGLPDRDYVLDWGDVIYGYEGMIRGYTGFLEQSSIVEHNLHPFDTLHFRRIGLHFVKLYYSPPIRSYYYWRNSIYFWLYVYRGKKLSRPTIKHVAMFLKWLVKVTLFIKRPIPILRACVRGMWDGLRGRLQNRF